MKSHKEVTKQWEIRFFLVFLLDRRIRSRTRIRTVPRTTGYGSGRPKNIRIPQHCFELINFMWLTLFRVSGIAARTTAPLLPAQRVDPVPGLPAARPLRHGDGRGAATCRPTAAAHTRRQAGGPLRHSAPAGTVLYQPQTYTYRWTDCPVFLAY